MIEEMVPFNRSETLARDIPNASLIKMSNAGHMFPLEQPDIFTSHIEAWLALLKK